MLWMSAAEQALKHLPADLIERGAAIALTTADHPSKIVPAIIAAVKDDLAWRKRTEHLARPKALPRKDVVADEERSEVAQMMHDLAEKMRANAA